MKKVIKLSVITLAVSLLSACATNSDIEHLQAQVNSLDSSVKQASADANNHNQPLPQPLQEHKQQKRRQIVLLRYHKKPITNWIKSLKNQC